MFDLTAGDNFARIKILDEDAALMKRTQLFKHLFGNVAIV